MSTLMESLGKMLAGSAMNHISKRAGVDANSTGKVISMALPILMGALSKIASRGSGAESLLGALSRDHDGSILDNMEGYINGPQALEDEGILGHVLGARRGRVESSIGRSAGIDAGSVGNIMKILAPIVMGQLGRQSKQSGLDASSLMNMLSSENSQMEVQSNVSPEALNSLLDIDGDGDVDLADLQKSGISSLLGSILKK